MNLKKKIIAVFTIIAMIIPNLVMPLSSIVYAAAGDSDRDILFTGNGLVFNQDGSISVEEFTDGNEGILNIKLYDNTNTLKLIENWTNDPAITQMLAETEYQGMTMAGASVPYSNRQTQSLQGHYLLITSDDANVSTLKFDIDGNWYQTDQDGKLFLPDGDWEGIDFRSIRDVNEKRYIDFQGSNVSIDGNTISMDSPIDYTQGRLSFTVYNSDNSVVTPGHYDDGEIVRDDGGYARLNTSTYQGAYMTVTATGNVDLSNIKFQLNGVDKFINDGKVYFQESEYNINIAEWSIREIVEKKETYIRGNNLVVSQNSVTIDNPIEDETGRLTFTFYNADESDAIVRARQNWDNATQQNIDSDTEGTVKFNAASYEGTYMIVTSQDVDLTKIKFEFNGVSYLVGENGRVNFPGDVENLSLEEWSIRPLYEKKEIQIRGGNLTIDDNTVTIDSPIYGNEGRLTMTFYNSNGSNAKVTRNTYYNEQTGHDEESLTEASVRFNTTTYDGTYMVVTAEPNGVDLTDLKFEFPYIYATVEQDTGIVNFPANAEWINIDEYTIRPLVDRKMISFDCENLDVEDNVITFDSPLEFNQGRMSIAFYNADGSKMSVQQYHMWNEELGQDELDPSCGSAGLKTTTFKDAYMIVTAEPDGVDLSDVKFSFCGIDVLIDKTGKAILPESLDEFWIGIDKYSITEVNTRKCISIHDKNITLNQDGTVTIDCNIVKNQGRITIGVYNADDKMVKLTQDINFDYEQNTNKPADFVWGKFKTSSFENTYLVVTSDGQVDLSKIAFDFAGNEVPVGNDGKVLIPNLEQDDIIIDSNAIKNSSKASVTVNTTSEDGYLADLTVNGVQFLDRDPSKPSEINQVNKTLDVEERENDEINICVDYGYIIKKLTINDNVIVNDGNSAFFNCEIAHCSTYNIQIECAVNESILPKMSWAYNDEEMWGPDAVVCNGRVEIVSVTLPDGVTVYDNEELQKKVNEPGVGEHYLHEDTAFFGVAYDQEGNVIGGELSAAEGCTVTLKVIPNYGYQVVSTQLNGGELVPDNNEKTQYTIVMPGNHLHLSGIIEPVNDVVKSETTKVESGTITIGANEFDTGSVILSVKDANQATLNKQGFENKAGEDGYEVKTYLDIDLQQVIYKGSRDNVWSEKAEDLNNKATITLKLAEGVNGDSIVIVHNIKNTGTFEIIPIESYNKTTNTITFKTNSFSDYAIATKNAQQQLEQVKFKDVSENDWYYNSVQYVYNNKIVSGYADGRFAPNDKITRGMFVTILYRMAGNPNVSGKSKFKDVQNVNDWYYKAVIWASSNGIVSGYADGRFAPNDNITREQLAVMLNKYAKYRGKDYSKTGNITGYSDYKKVSDWATNQVKWAVGTGVITGNQNGTLNPGGNATRAEAAAMIEKYCKKVGR